MVATADDLRAVRLPRPLAHQQPVWQADSRNKILACGRRWGKTTLCLDCVLLGHGPIQPDGTPKYKGALHGQRIWWIAPVYSQSVGVWASLKAASSPRSARERNDPESVIYKSEVERTIFFPGGGQVSVKTADDPDNLRGYAVDGVVFDEAAFMKEETYTQVLRPALMDRQGWAIFISTPNGLNWYYTLFEESADREDWMRWQQPTWNNPVIPMEEIEKMRRDPSVSTLAFQQEVEAQFVEAGAGMFKAEYLRHYRIDVDDEGGPSYVLHHGEDIQRVSSRDLTKFATVDLAVTEKTTSNYTVISTWGVTPGHDLLLLDCNRFRAEGPDIVPRIRAGYEMWRPQYIGIERVGFQMAIVQEAERSGLPVRELTPHRDKLARAMTPLAYMEKGKVWFPAEAPWLHDIETELVQFPVSEYDDFVDTLSYAAAELASERFAPVVVPLAIGQSNPWTIR